MTDNSFERTLIVIFKELSLVGWESLTSPEECFYSEELREGQSRWKSPGFVKHPWEGESAYLRVISVGGVWGISTVLGWEGKGC